MPIFEYRCEDCGATFEKLVRRATDSVECPSCGQSHLKTEFSTFAARSSNGAKAAEPFPSCPSGLCRTPDLCGRN